MKTINKGILVLLLLLVAAVLVYFGYASQKKSGHSTVLKDRGASNSRVDTASGTAIDRKNSTATSATNSEESSTTKVDLSKSPFIGYDRLKVAPANVIMSALKTFLESERSTSILGVYLRNESRRRQESIDVLKAKIEIGPPIDAYIFTREKFISRQTIETSDLCHLSYHFPFIMDGKEIMYATIDKEPHINEEKKLPSMSWAASSWYGPDTFESIVKGTMRQRVKVSTVPHIFECYGAYSQNESIDDAEFYCEQLPYGLNTRWAKIPGPLSFKEIASKAQAFFDENLRELYEENPNYGLGR